MMWFYQQILGILNLIMRFFSSSLCFEFDSYDLIFVLVCALITQKLINRFELNFCYFIDFHHSFSNRQTIITKRKKRKYISCFIIPCYIKIFGYKLMKNTSLVRVVIMISKVSPFYQHFSLMLRSYCSHRDDI